LAIAVISLHAFATARAQIHHGPMNTERPGNKQL